jgi:hypothetical protein
MQRQLLEMLATVEKGNTLRKVASWATTLGAMLLGETLGCFVGPVMA